jgi:hypothetical protein
MYISDIYFSQFIYHNISNMLCSPSLALFFNFHYRKYFFEGWKIKLGKYKIIYFGEKRSHQTMNRLLSKKNAKKAKGLERFLTILLIHLWPYILIPTLNNICNFIYLSVNVLTGWLKIQTLFLAFIHELVSYFNKYIHWITLFN